MRSSIRSLAIALSTVAAVVVAPLALDLRTTVPSDGTDVGREDVAVVAVVHGTRASSVPPRLAPTVQPTPTVVDTSTDDAGYAPGVASTEEAGVDVVTAETTPPVPAGVVVDALPDEGALAAAAAATDLPATWTGPSAEPLVEALVESPVEAPVEPLIEAPVEASTGSVVPAGVPVGDGVSGGTIDGPGSGMGGDLPPEALPTPPYPQCPITEAGAWWTDPVDPHTCIPPGSMPFHEPTPPGIAPELLEPIFEDPAPADEARMDDTVVLPPSS